MKALIPVLVDLFEEPKRPLNPLEYIRNHFGAPEGVDVGAMRTENNDLKRRKLELELQLESLTMKLHRVKEDQEDAAWLRRR